VYNGVHAGVCQAAPVSRSQNALRLDLRMRSSWLRPTRLWTSRACLPVRTSRACLPVCLSLSLLRVVSHALYFHVLTCVAAASACAVQAIPLTVESVSRQATLSLSAPSCRSCAGVWVSVSAVRKCVRELRLEQKDALTEADFHCDARTRARQKDILKRIFTVMFLR